MKNDVKIIDGKYMKDIDNGVLRQCSYWEYLYFLWDKNFNNNIKPKEAQDVTK